MHVSNRHAMVTPIGADSDGRISTTPPRFGSTRRIRRDASTGVPIEIKPPSDDRSHLLGATETGHWNKSGGRSITWRRVRLLEWTTLVIACQGVLRLRFFSLSSSVRQVAAQSPRWSGHRKGSTSSESVGFFKKKMGNDTNAARALCVMIVQQQLDGASSLIEREEVGGHTRWRASKTRW